MCKFLGTGLANNAPCYSLSFLFSELLISNLLNDLLKSFRVAITCIHLYATCIRHYLLFTDDQSVLYSLRSGHHIGSLQSSHYAWIVETPTILRRAILVLL